MFIWRWASHHSWWHKITSNINFIFSFSNETGKLLTLHLWLEQILILNALKFLFLWLGCFMLFIVSLAFVTIILAMFGISFEDAIVLAVACLTTTGPIIEAIGINSSLISKLSFFKINFSRQYGIRSSRNFSGIVSDNHFFKANLIFCFFWLI